MRTTFIPPQSDFSVIHPTSPQLRHPPHHIFLKYPPSWFFASTFQKLILHLLLNRGCASTSPTFRWSIKHGFLFFEAMGDADDPSRDANQPLRNDLPVASEGMLYSVCFQTLPNNLSLSILCAGDRHYYDKLLTHLQTFLPFLTEVINNCKLLDIPPDRVSKLQYLYELVDAKRFASYFNHIILLC